MARENKPNDRTVVNCNANPRRLYSPRCRAINALSASSRKNTRSSSDRDGGPPNRPYAAASSSLRNSTGTPGHSTNDQPANPQTPGRSTRGAILIVTFRSDAPHGPSREPRHARDQLADDHATWGTGKNRVTRRKRARRKVPSYRPRRNKPADASATRAVLAGLCYDGRSSASNTRSGTRGAPVPAPAANRVAGAPANLRRYSRRGARWWSFRDTPSVWATRRTAPGMCACGRIGCARGIWERSQRLSWWSGQTAGADPWLLGHAADLGAGAGGIGALSRCACREPGGPRRWARDGRHARFGERAG